MKYFSVFLDLFYFFLKRFDDNASKMFFISCDSLNLSKPIFFCWLDLFFPFTAKKKNSQKHSTRTAKESFEISNSISKEKRLPKKRRRKKLVYSVFNFLFSKKVCFLLLKFFFHFFKEQKNSLLPKERKSVFLKPRERNFCVIWNSHETLNQRLKSPFSQFFNR